jgi:hypothetical protein
MLEMEQDLRANGFLDRVDGIVDSDRWAFEGLDGKTHFSQGCGPDLPGLLLTKLEQSPTPSCRT